MIAIQQLTLAELPAAGAVLDAAFGRVGMLASLRLAYDLQPASWFCLRHNGQIVAVVGGHDYGPFAYLGMMGVHPSAQKQGFGLRLMGALVDYLDGIRCPMMLLDASAFGQGLYPKLGFQPEGETLRMARQESSRPGPPDATGLSPMPYADLTAVAAFDAPIFGADRSAALRSFWADSPAGAFVSRDEGGRVDGFIMGSGSHIGPWAASSPDAGGRLLAAALALPFEHLPFLTCPAANTAALALLARHGFAVSERLLHMRRGGSADPRQVAHIFGQASLTLG